MIRPATEKDIPEILTIYAPYVENTTVTFEYDVPCLESFTQRFLDITAQYPWLVWEEDGNILGYAYASAPYSRAAFSWCAEPSIYLRPEAKGKGAGRKLYGILEKILEKQGYQVLYALITSENTESISFHQGWAMTGKQTSPAAATNSGVGWDLPGWKNGWALCIPPVVSQNPGEQLCKMQKLFSIF